MFNIEFLNAAPHTESVCWMSADEVFYCLVEANHNDPTQYEARVLRKLLFEAQMLIKPEISLPLSWANALKATSESWLEAKGRHQIVFYAGVLLKPSKVEVCTAGDIRVHLTKDESILAVTRDHNMVDDVPESTPDWVRNRPREFLHSVPTRYIGDGCTKPPELQIWNITGAYSVIICTSQVHKYQAAEKYLQPLSGQGIKQSLSSNLTGAITKIHFNSSG
ncbi:MAG: hypothetical protein AB7U82_25320 [Blastocatellales bacterium]